MGRLPTALATAAVVAALAAQSSPAQAPPQSTAPAGASSAAPATTVTTSGAGAAPTSIETGDTASGPSSKPSTKPKPDPKPTPNGGTEAGDDAAAPKPDRPPNEPLHPSGLDVPSVPTAVCGSAFAPPTLVPIYEAASTSYALGPQGPAVLAAINQIETNFGELNNVTSSAGAVGWMQFLPSTWARFGVDADGNGVADPHDPEDAIFAAARYLSAAGMPEDTAGAIFAYNHADWYVAQVLANAGCYSGDLGTTFSLTPRQLVLTCAPAASWRSRIPDTYLEAFERAAGHYELGRRGVWALSAVARLESNFGRNLSRAEMRRNGALGIDAAEWRRYAVDGDGDGRIRAASIEDSAATLARLIWSRGDLRAGLFTHNQATWYVQEVLHQAELAQGRCKVTTAAWPILFPETAGAPVNWGNLTLSNELEQRDLDSGAIDPRIVGLIGAITQRHTITVSALRSDHSMLTAEGNVSNHYFGRAMDIAVVDGVPCTDTAPSAPCAVLGRSLSLLPAPAHPTELIYCFDLDGPGPAFARADHCDHLHVGFDG
jgi:Transglycosylase SLT domain